MFWSCMHISALCNSCDAAPCMMFYSFEILSSFTLLMGKSVLPSQSLSSSDLSRQIQHACIHSFSPSLSLCICMVFICMVLCFALITRRWSATHKYTYVFFPRSHCLSRHIRWSCRASSEGHVWYLPTPLFLFSLLFLSTPLSLSHFYSQQHHLWRRPARCPKVALVLFGRIAPTRAVLSQWSKWPRSRSFLVQRS